jgi:hypothetical protein
MSKSISEAGARLRRVPSSEQTFALVVAAAFLVVGLFNVLHHEMWRDELQAWLIAEGSGSLRELVRNMSYDGHPPLWYLLLYVASRLTDDPSAMQFLHVGIATAAAYVFARHAPFSRLNRALFCFGYFPAYEYAVISRNYAAGVLCLFVFCAAYRAGAGKRYLPLAVPLALLANTSAYGLMLAAALSLMLAYEFLREPRLWGRVRERWPEVGAAALVMAAAAGLAAWQMYPPADSGNVLYRTSDLGIDGVRYPLAWPFTLSVFWRAFAPLPRLSYHLWNGNALDAESPVVAVLSFVILAATVLTLVVLRRRAALVAYLAGTGAILLFVHTKFYGSVRHHGHIYVLFVACLWLAARAPEDAPLLPRGVNERAARFIKRHGARVAAAFLAFHVLDAAYFCRADWLYPFSRSRDAAELIRARGLEGLYVVADQDAQVSPVTAYLHKKFYYQRADREGTFVVWDKAWRSWPEQNLLLTARRKASERGEPVLVVSNYRLPPDDSTEPVAEITGSIVSDEDYYIYVGCAAPAGL